jgi:hypothetical protein
MFLVTARERKRWVEPVQHVVGPLVVAFFVSHIIRWLTDVSFRTVLLTVYLPALVLGIILAIAGCRVEAEKNQFDG